MALETRKNTPIRNLPRLDKPPTYRRAIINETLAHHPNAELRSATAVYNCFGIPFAARRTWVDFDHDDELLTILADDGFRRLPAAEYPRPGDLVLYKDNENSYAHVAVILQVEFTYQPRFRVLSQWGELGEYVHHHDDVPPLYGQTVEYWTDRVPMP